MNKIRMMLLALIAGLTTGPLTAQVTTNPPAKMGKALTITFDATQGNKGLMGYTGDVYAHTGVITQKSTSDSDWKHTSTWNKNEDKYKMTRSATNPNIYTLSIPDIATFYNVTSTETVKKLAFVFRSSDSSKQAKTAENGDILVELWGSDFAIRFSQSVSDRRINVETATVTFTVEASDNATLELTVDDQSIAKVTDASTLVKTYTFPGSKDDMYKIKAIGTLDGKSVSKSFSYKYVESSPAMDYPGGVPQMGAKANADGSVTFCIAAPKKGNAKIIGSWNDYADDESTEMYYQSYQGNRYFWKTIANLDPKTEYLYYYSFDDGTANVGDPYARLVLDPYNDKYISETVFPGMPDYPTGKVPNNTLLAIYKGTHDDYDWKIKDFKGPDPEHLIIYEMLFRDFTGDEGLSKGNGTVRKAIEKLPYLKELGVNAVELMPIMEFNGNNSWGYNTNFYFAPDKAYGTPDDYREFIDKCHEMDIAVILDIVFNQSDGLHPWYKLYSIASNPFYNQTAPHDYSVLNDWNQDNPIVQQQWIDVVKYWLSAYKVDGFRFDLVKGLGDNNSYGNGTDAYNATRVARMKKIHAAMKEVNPYAYHINELLGDATEEKELAADGQINWANVSGNSINFANGTTSSLTRFYAPRDGQRTLGTTVSYAESHDEERMAYSQTKNGKTGVKGNHAVSMRRLGSVAAAMLMAPGAHMIWQFGELGADQTTKKSSDNDTSPKKVIWSYLDDADRNGLFTSYKELIAIRNDYMHMFSDDAFEKIIYSATRGYLKLAKDNEEIHLAINPSPTDEKEIALELNSTNTNGYKILSKSYNTEPKLDVVGLKVTLPAGGYVVIGSSNLSGIEDVVSDNDAVKCHVYGTTGRIVIEGEYDNATVYTVSGQLCPSLEVPAGLYIVNIDGNATKVVVR